MGLVFPAGHGLLTAGDLPVAESDTQLAHTRPEFSSIHAGLPRWTADGMSAVRHARTAQSRPTSRLPVTDPHDALLDYFRIANHPEVNCVSFMGEAVEVQLRHRVCLSRPVSRISYRDYRAGSSRSCRSTLLSFHQTFTDQWERAPAKGIRFIRQNPAEQLCYLTGSRQYESYAGMCDHRSANAACT